MRIVDVHAHYYPKPYLTLLRRIVANDSTPWGRHNAMTLAGNIGGTPAMWEIAAHIDDMDAAGVEVQALSLSHPRRTWETKTSQSRRPASPTTRWPRSAPAIHRASRVWRRYRFRTSSPHCTS